jgi:LPS-assembly lipoprotein
MAAGTLRALLVALLVAALAAGCGFRPRGGLALPPDLGPLRVQAADPFSDLVLPLQRSLQRSGALPPPAAEAERAAVLRIVSEVIDNRPLSVDNRARVQEYLTRYLVVFELAAADGAVLVPRQEVVLEREYSFDTAAALGTPGEQEIVLEDLKRDMVAAILRRVDTVLRQPAAG